LNEEPKVALRKISVDTVYMHMYLRAHGGSILRNIDAYEEELTKDSVIEWMKVLSLIVFYKSTTNALDNIGN